MSSKKCLTRVASKSVLQKSQVRSVKQEVSYKKCLTRVPRSVLQECQLRVSSKRAVQECQVRVSHKSVLQECQVRVSYKSVK